MVDDPEDRATVARAPAAALTSPGSGAELDSAVLTAVATIIPAWSAGAQVSLPDPGYQLGDVIGRGGMGEVVAAHDQRIGREVAIKRIRTREPSSDAVTRFLREARIQARLDHPAIVPVYDLGTDEDGRPYFTMKRLAGVTLAHRLVEGGGVQPMLRAFVDVCLAIQLAHTRGVVHRDLKPSNIMLGDYGEVYVLDWGVARVLADRRRTTHPAMLAEVDDSTTAGAILGTPGYMAPEQIEGHEVGPPADVYALGSILFEILAGEALHPRGEAALASTLTRPQEAPAARGALRAIPPELDEVCFDTLARKPEARPTAREVADRVQAYLDGDRDIERRRALAAQRVAAARAALASNEPDAHATAVREAGRALALDPQSEEAAALVTSLTFETPDPLPADLVASLAAEDGRYHRQRSALGMWTYLGLFAFWLAIPFLRVKNWPELLAFFGLLALGAASAGVAARRATGRSSVLVTYVLTACVVLGFTRVAGPFMLTPIVVCAILMSISAIPELAGWRLIAWVASAALLPFVLEWAGVIHQTFWVGGGVVVTRSDLFDMRGPLDEGVLVGTNVLFLVSAALVAIGLTRRRVAIQRELHIRQWQLRQLLPRGWSTRRQPPP